MCIPQYIIVNAAYNFVKNRTLIEIRYYLDLSQRKAAKLLRVPRMSLAAYEKRADGLNDVNISGVRYRYIICILFGEIKLDLQKFIEQFS